MEKKGHSQEEMCGGMCGQCNMCDEGCGEQMCDTGCQQMYGMRCGGRHYLLRWVLGILIIVLVFIAGIKVGEFKQDMRANGYGYRMMDSNNYGMMQGRNDIDVYNRYGMMRGAGATTPVAPIQ